MKNMLVLLEYFRSSSSVIFRCFFYEINSAPCTSVCGKHPSQRSDNVAQNHCYLFISISSLPHAGDAVDSTTGLKGCEVADNGLVNENCRFEDHTSGYDREYGSLMYRQYLDHVCNSASSVTRHGWWTFHNMCLVYSLFTLSKPRYINGE